MDYWGRVVLVGATVGWCRWVEMYDGSSSSSKEEMVVFSEVRKPVTAGGRGSFDQSCFASPCLLSRYIATSAVGVWLGPGWFRHLVRIIVEVCIICSISCG